jgi:hypothetical protein
MKKLEKSVQSMKNSPSIEKISKSAYEGVSGKVDTGVLHTVIFA